MKLAPALDDNGPGAGIPVMKTFFYILCFQHKRSPER